MGLDLKPFFCYYGGKYNLSKYLPAPSHTTIIEPFAGAAGYSVRYAERKVILYEIDSVIAGLWDYLIKVTPAEVKTLPLKVNHVDDLRVCQEAKYLIGFWLAKGYSSPGVRPSRPMRESTSWIYRPASHWGPEIRSRIAFQVRFIKHWRVYNKSYELAPNKAATWMIDPPYQGAGVGYKFGSKLLDYTKLGAWCRGRRGQVMVCENEGAAWLPFKFYRSGKSNARGGSTSSREAVYVQ